MDRFSKLNPRVNFLFFLFVIILTLSLFNPVYLLISFLSSFFYDVKLQGKRAVKMFFTYILPLTFFVAVFNMLFTSYGETVLFNAFSKSFTIEGFFYGLCQGAMLSSVIMWISCYCQVLTTDKFLSVFSGAAPNISILLSTVFSFIPRLNKNAREINDARANINTTPSKLKKSIDNFSALVSLTLEESIELADSMRARGFNRDRKVYSKYKFNAKDGVLTALMIIAFIIVLIFKFSGKTDFIFEPVIAMGKMSAGSIIVYALLCFLPLIINFAEDMRWLYLKQKI